MYESFVNTVETEQYPVLCSLISVTDS